MDAAERQYRQIGKRVLELLAAIELEQPKVDEQRAAKRLRACVKAQHWAVRPVRFTPDLRALREALWPGRVWPDRDRDASRGERRWMLLDERWARPRGEPTAEPPFPGVQGLVDTDRTVLTAALGDSHQVGGVRWLTPTLHVRARQLVAGELKPERPRRWFTPPPVETLLPLAEAVAAGLFAFGVGRNGDFVAVLRPRLRLDPAGRLHNWDGHPAAEWPGGRGLYFWRGVEMSDGAGRNPEGATPARIARWTNAEQRRVAIERIGLERFMSALGAYFLQQDDYGTLWRTDREIDGEPYVAVAVANATVEPDGSRKRYFLRVPPGTRSAREGVAWSFGLEPRDYEPAVET